MDSPVPRWFEQPAYLVSKGLRELSSSKKRIQRPMGVYRRQSHEPAIDQRAETPEPHPLGDAEMSDPPRIERPYQVDDQWSRAVFLRRTGEVRWPHF